MKTGMRYILLLYGAMLAWTVSTAQSLDSLLHIARTNNLQLKALNQQYLSALEIVPQVGQLPDPEVELGVFVRSTETRVGPQRARIGASQMFPWKGTLKARENVALAKAMTRYESIEATERNLVFTVKRAYFNLYDISKSQTIIRRNQRIFDALDRFTLSKIESGKGSAADVLRVQLKRQELNQELALLENRKFKYLATLNQVLNRPLDTPVAITDSLVLAQPGMDRDTLAQHIARTHPALRMLSRQQEVSQREMDLNVLNGKPSFGVGLDFVLVDKRPDIDIRDNGKNIIMPMASVRIPLNRTKYTAKDREEQLMIDALEARKQDVQLQFLAIIESALSDLEDAALRLELYKKLTRTTEATISILETQYSTSGQGFDELLRLQNELVEYDLKILKAIVQSHIAKAVIERYITS